MRKRVWKQDVSTSTYAKCYHEQTNKQTNKELCSNFYFLKILEEKVTDLFTEIQKITI